MKTWALTMAWGMSFAMAVAQTPLASKIDGAFGKRLGDPVEVGAERLVRGPEGLQYSVTFVPAEGYPGLSTFAVGVTPYSHKIFKVEASGTFPTPAAVDNLRRTLELKYGPFLRIEDPSGVFRWKFSDGERSILLLSDANGLVKLFYIDDSLAAAARIESTTGAANDGKSL